MRQLLLHLLSKSRDNKRTHTISIYFGEEAKKRVFFCRVAHEKWRGGEDEDDDDDAFTLRLDFFRCVVGRLGFT